MLARLLYSFVFYCVTPLVLLRLGWRSFREPVYRDTLSQRFGFVARSTERPIWVHAVSAGETIAAVPLVRRLIKDGHAVIVTTMTPTGRERVVSLLGNDVEHCYAPYDLPDAVNRFLSSIRPKALIILDTELWPNIIHYTHARGIPGFLVNGRLSEKSARGYDLIAPISRPMLNKLTRVCVQSESQGYRFRQLGVSEKQLDVTGSIKFDSTLPDDLQLRRSELTRKFVDKKVSLAASTHEGEETEILDAFKAIAVEPTNLLVLAPRHPHRSDRVYELCVAKGMRVVRHSENRPCLPETQVYLLDTMGELVYFYSIAHIAIVGGSLVDVGGHNPMEPASQGVPMIMGWYRRNIDDIADQFIQAGAMEVVSDQKELLAVWQGMLVDKPKLTHMADAALVVMNANRGALDRVEKVILAIIDG